MKIKKALTAALTCVLIAASAVPAFAAKENGAYSDISADFWGFNCAMWATKEGLMNGVDDGVFAPDKPMTRAMLVTVLYRFEGEPEIKSFAPFKDITGDWYMSAVSWAYENDIVNGVSADRFEPDDSITREQIATIFYRFSEHKGYDVSYDDTDFEFSDIGDIQGYAVAAMKWAFSQRLITGVANGADSVLNPAGNASRAQVATILYRFGMSVSLDSPYKLLADYVRENGEKTEEGYGLAIEIEEDGAAATAVVYSYENGKDFEFSMYIENADGIAVTASMFLSLGMSRQEIVVVSELDGESYIFDGSILSSSFSGDNLDVSLNDGYPEELKEPANLLLGVCADAILQLTRALFEEYNFEITLSMLGFINY